MFIVHVHCSLFMFIVHCSHGATLIFDDLFFFKMLSCKKFSGIRKHRFLKTWVPCIFRVLKKFSLIT